MYVLFNKSYMEPLGLLLQQLRHTCASSMNCQHVPPPAEHVPSAKTSTPTESMGATPRLRRLHIFFIGRAFRLRFGTDAKNDLAMAARPSFADDRAAILKHARNLPAVDFQPALILAWQLQKCRVTRIRRVTNHDLCRGSAQNAWHFEPCGTLCTMPATLELERARARF